MTVARDSMLTCLCACSKKLKFAELSIQLFLVVLGNNFGKMEVTLYIDGVAYKN
jgi:hypothetical protein